MGTKTIDVATIGRCSVDLYGQQIGGRLEDMASFSKAVGGCPANIAIGAARLGLRSALISRVGDEHFGRFIREQLAREGVATDGLRTDPERLTALAFVGVRDEHRFPLLFYRTDCADAALDESDIDADLLSRTGAVVVTGTHFARPASAAAQRRAMRIMHENGGTVVLDIDYRPNLWGLAGHGAGENRYVRSADVSAAFAAILPDCDLVVGTEEELHVAGGEEDTLAALRAIRARTAATIVCKRGPMGCVVFEDLIGTDWSGGVTGPGFPVEVYNTLGAGDAFMAGFLRGWLRSEGAERAATYANACGAFAVSRLLCSPEIPTERELMGFLAEGSRHRALRHDDALNHLHHATTRRAQAFPLLALACDHRPQLEAIADAAGADRSRIARFKRLAVDAAALVAGGRPGFGVFLDGDHGRAALFAASHAGLWIARPIERAGARPLDFEGGGSLGARTVEWPTAQVAKCLCFYHPDDPEPLRERQRRELARAADACRRQGRELLIEIIAGKHGVLADDTVARAVAELYEAGLKPDWWKLEPQCGAAAWRAIGSVIERHDPFCRGVLVLGLEAPVDALAESFAAAAATPVVRGFAVGRTVWAEAASAWFANRIDDAAAIDAMAARFAALERAWHAAQTAGGGTSRAVSLEAVP